MRDQKEPGSFGWDDRYGCMMAVQPDGSLAPWRPTPSPHTAEAVLAEAEELDEWRPAGPDDLHRETICDREDRLFPKLLDRDAEDRALLAAEVATSQRPDGWTLARRELFLERLADTCSVLEAAASVGLSRQSARKLYRRAPAFRAAWDAALAESVAVLAETAFHRARFGTETEVYYNGHVVGHRTVHHDRLLMYLLRVRDPLNYAPIDEVERWQRQRAVPARGRTLDAAADAPAALPPSALAAPDPQPRETSAPFPAPAEPSPPPHGANMETSPPALAQDGPASPPHQGNMETSRPALARKTAPPPPDQGNMETSCPPPAPMRWTGGNFGFVWRAAARLTPAAAP